MAEKKNPDYAASAVMLTNPPQVYGDLVLIRQCNAAITELRARMDTYVPQDLKDSLSSFERQLEAANKDIRIGIDLYGSYQDPDKGEYAIKQKRESIIYKPELVRQYAPSKVASFVIIESVDSKGLDALLKAGLITPEVARQCGEVKESFAYIVR